MNETVTRRETPLTELRPAQWWKEQPEELNALSDHIIQKLILAGIKTVEQVRAAGPEKLLAIDGIGRGALQEIKTWLRSLDSERR